MTKAKRNLMSLYAKPAHKAVARSIGFALTNGDELGWQCFAAVSVLRLTEAERAAMTFAALQTLNPEHEVMTVQAALGREVS